MVNDLEAMVFGLLDKRLRARQDKLANQVAREYKRILGTEIIADEHRIKTSLCRLIKNLVRLEVKIGDPFNHRSKNLRFRQHVHEGRFHPEGGTRVLNMRRPDK